MAAAFWWRQDSHGLRDPSRRGVLCVTADDAAESSARYELGRLEKLGVLLARKGGREKYYRINNRHPLFPDFTQMVHKTAG